MKQNILKLFYIPIIFFVLISFIYFISVYFILKKELNVKIIEIKKELIKEKKEELKKRVNNVNSLIDLIRKSVYSSTLEELEEFLKLYIKVHNNEFYSNDILIIGKIPSNIKFTYKILDNKYVLLKYHNKLYLTFFKNKGKNIYIAGINKNFIDDIVIQNIKKYLDLISNSSNYFGLAKILTFNPGKNGVFAQIVYLPVFFKNREGMFLSVNNPDIKGNYFRKKYLKCLKNNKNKNCYVKYYFLNPATQKIEEKLSYITYNKFYKFMILSGIYSSQIKQAFIRKTNKYINELTHLIVILILIYLFIFSFFMIILYFILKKIKLSLLEEYEILKYDLENKYYYDNVTNLPNRNKLLLDEKNALSIMILDIKNFSHINEIYGYEKGDEILKFIANALKEKYEFVYRIGDDEFAVLLDRILSEDDISIEYHSLLFNYNQFINITFLIGASNEKDNLLKTAEIALSFAISENKDYMLFNKEIEELQKEKYEKIEFLKYVLINDKIKPFYQCIVNRKKEIIKYEALIRVIDKNKIYSPYYFMDYLIEGNLYNAFSRNMIMKVLNDVKKSYINKASINLSFEDINDEITRNMLYNYIDDAIGEKLIIEILESESINDFDMVKKFIDNMKKRGVSIAIDDFGSGYSNFIVILDLSPDYIKIDSSLIQNINNKKYYDIVNMIIDFAHRYKIKVIAEYVDSQDVFEKLLSMGIDEFQGYYFCEPQPLENIIKKDKISSKKGNNED